jgi:hypothetical protein
MVVHPAIIIHGLADARCALAVGAPVTLLSAPGAALFAGCLWWRTIIAAARGQFPAVPMTDILDCADGSGHALAALRIGVRRLVLWPEAPGWVEIAAIAEEHGGHVWPCAPPALDLGQPQSPNRLNEWLRARPTPDDSGAAVR